jgi:hypothetical protein
MLEMQDHAKEKNHHHHHKSLTITNKVVYMTNI